MSEFSLERSELLAENKKIIESFRSRGLDLNKTREFDFQVALPNKEACKSVRAKLRAEYSMPKDGLFMIKNYPDECTLVLSILMKPSPEVISQLEEKLILASASFDDSEVTWGFEE